MDFDILNSFIFNRHFENSLLGNFLECCSGYSSNKRIRRDASSGGITTSLLLFLLESKIVDGVLVLKMADDAPLEPAAILARTKDEVMIASGSKYCPAPVNVRIKEILAKKGKYAVVGLPCHIHGIRKAEMFTKELKERIVLHIGLFCAHSVNFAGTELVLHRSGIRKEHVLSLRYRGKGWPGKMSVGLIGRDAIDIDYRLCWDGMFGCFFFTPMRCTLCSDATNELADLSIGDAWLPQFDRSIDREGRSVVIVRTDIGRRLLERARTNRKIELVSLDQNAVVFSQRSSLNFKKKALGTRAHFLNSLGKLVPQTNPSPPTDGVMSYLSTFFLYLNICLSSNSRLRFLLRYVPFALLKTYFKFLCALLISM